MNLLARRAELTEALTNLEREIVFERGRLVEAQAQSQPVAESREASQ